MRAILVFTLAAALCIVGAWWVAALPGTVSATIAGTTLEAATPVALTLLGLLFLVLYGIVRVLAGLYRLPRTVRRAARESRRRRGDQAVTRTLVSLAADDAGAARRDAGRARRLLGDTPLTLLLAAQAGQQAKRDTEAQEVFRLLSERKDGKLLGLRGLLRQAIAERDWTKAAGLAQQAEAAHPGAAWLVDERRRLALETGQWREAMRLSGSSRNHEADPGAQAALGVAAANAEPDAPAALRVAKQAWDADPALGPAALAYAERLRASGKERIALDVLRKTWAAAPQPSLAEAYMAPQPDKLARMRAAEELAAANPSHPDTNIMLSRVALDTGLVGRARRYAEAARTAGLDGQRLYVLLADLAEVERDPDGAQEALRNIPTASPDPAWQCGNCATVHTAWHPVCDSCGTPGRIRWTSMEGSHAAANPARTVRAIEGFS